MADRETVTVAVLSRDDLKRFIQLANQCAVESEVRHMASRPETAQQKALGDAPSWVVAQSTRPYPGQLPDRASRAFRVTAEKWAPLCSSLGEFKRKLGEGALTVNGKKILGDIAITADDFLAGRLVLGNGKRRAFWSLQIDNNDEPLNRKK